jgi:hypothetical protein
MTFYYYLEDEKNTENFTKLMNALDINFWKSNVEIFSNKYIFISVLDKKDFFQKLLISGVFQFTIYPFGEI